MATEPRLPAAPKLWKRVPAGRVLAFAPHPDDEAAGPGGVLALHREQRDPVRVVVATDGVSGDPDRRFDASAYAALRRAESRAGLAHLGVDDVEFWGFPDGHVLSEVDLEHGVRLALGALDAFGPDVVYLPWEHDPSASRRGSRSTTPGCAGSTPRSPSTGASAAAPRRPGRGRPPRTARGSSWGR